MTTRRRPSLCGTIVLGLGLMPFVCALTFFGLVLAGEAMGLGSLTYLEKAVEEALVDAGLAPATPVVPAATPSAAPSLTPFLPASATTLTDTDTPSPTASPSLTSSPSATSTLTPTPTGTATWTASPTPTVSPTASRSATLAATRTRTPTFTPTRTASATLSVSATPSPSVTVTATVGPPPTETVTVEGQPTETAATPGPPTSTPVPPTPTLTPTTSTCDAAANATVEAQVIDLVNAERVAQGLAAYTVDSRLTAAARVHATDMACNHFTSHTGSDGSSVRDRVERQGYTWSWIGENYYVGGGSAQTAFNWWMNSTLHRANLLSPNYTQFGVGYVYDADSDYGGYFVVVFARPG